MRCPSCGHENVSDALYCNQCGRPLVAVVHEPPAPSHATSTPSSSPPPFVTTDVARAAGLEPAAPGVAPNFKKACARCGSVNDAASQFCYHCGWILANAPVKDASTGIPAGFWIRVLAAIIDGVILWILGLGIGAFFSNPQDVGPILTPSDVWRVMERALMSTESLMGTLYSIILVGAAGGTVGKLVLGLHIVRVDGRKVGYGRAFARYLASTLSALCLGLGYLWIVFNKDKRGWHDYLCDTKVVRKA